MDTFKLASCRASGRILELRKCSNGVEALPTLSVCTVRAPDYPGQLALDAVECNLAHNINITIRKAYSMSSSPNALKQFSHAMKYSPCARWTGKSVICMLSKTCPRLQSAAPVHARTKCRNARNSLSRNGCARVYADAVVRNVQCAGTSPHMVFVS